MSRRYPALVLLMVLVIAIAFFVRRADPVESVQFGTPPAAWMPHTDSDAGVSDSWFCPGVPTTGSDGIEGEIAMSNGSDRQLTGSALVINDAGENQRIDLSIPAYGQSSIDLDSLLPGEVVGAVVEFDAAGALVEQVAHNSSGDSSSVCSNTTSSTWYFADGSTVDGSTDKIVLTNPSEQAIVARLEFTLASGYRTPGAYSSIAVPARGIRIVDLGVAGGGAQNESLLAVKVEASRGQLVVGRIQDFQGGGRAGTEVSVGSPALSAQWWFAGGVNGPSTTELYTIFNPTDDRVDVEVVLLGTQAVPNDDGSPTSLDVATIAVPSFSVVSFDPSTVDGLGDGPYAAVLATLSDPAIVVERATTMTAGDETTTSVIFGAIARPEDGYVASQWHVVTAPQTATTGALRIYNADYSPGTLTVSVVGPSGPTPVPALTDIPLPDSSTTLSIDLTDESLLGRELIIDTTSRVFVETWFPTGVGDTRTVGWALPAG